MNPLPPRRGAPSSPLRALGLGLGAAALVVGAILGFDLIPREVPPRPPPAGARPPPEAYPASADAVALLGGLAAGDRAAGWTVVGVDASRDPALDRAIAVRLARPDAEVTVWISTRAPGQRLPVRETERYALYASRAPADAGHPREAEREAVVEALAARVRAHEGRVTQPAELERGPGPRSE